MGILFWANFQLLIEGPMWIKAGYGGVSWVVKFGINRFK